MLDLHFNPFPELETERLLLRKLRQEDASDIFEIRSDSGVMKYMARPVLRSQEEAGKYIEHVLNRFTENNAIDWGIEEKASKKLIGTIAFWRIEKDNYRAEIGFTLNKKWQMKGVMHEALAPVIRFGFEKMKLHSICADIDPLNEASIKLVEKNNFRREGFFRENRLFEDMYIDSLIYSLVKSIDYNPS